MSVAPTPSRVLHVMGGASGGAAITTASLIRGLALAGVESSVVCNAVGTPEERDELEETVAGRILFTPLLWWNRKTRAVWWKRPLAEARQRSLTGGGRRSSRMVEQFARIQQAELIHTNTILTPEGGHAASRLGLPHVWHVREMIGRGEPYRFWRESQFFQRRVYPRTSVVVANSHVAAARLRAASGKPPVPIEIVPNGIDLEVFLDMDLPSHLDPLTVVAMVGNLGSQWKRHELFIRAAAAVDRSLPVEFRIIGHDPSESGARPDAYVDHLRRLVRELGVEDRFVFAGFHADPKEVFAGVDVLVHPAESESFGRIAVEAMAAGRPVVGVAGGGIGEVVVDGVTGLLAPPGDAEALGRHIERVVVDRDLRMALGTAGRLRAIAEYSAEAMTEGVLDVYRRAMTHPVGKADPS